MGDAVGGSPGGSRRSPGGDTSDAGRREIHSCAALIARMQWHCNGIERGRQQRPNKTGRTDDVAAWCSPRRSLGRRVQRGTPTYKTSASALFGYCSRLVSMPLRRPLRYMSIFIQ
jgi:hypothetical protein